MADEVFLGEDYRVKAERKAHEEIYKLFASVAAKDPEGVPFLSLKDAFMWAVTLGYNAGKRTPLEGAKEGIFWFYQFSKETDLTVLKMIALAETGDVYTLTQEDQIMQMAEEYANAGIYLLQDALTENHGAPLWNLTNLVSS